MVVIHTSHDCTLFQKMKGGTLIGIMYVVGSDVPQILADQTVEMNVLNPDAHGWTTASQADRGKPPRTKLGKRPSRNGAESTSQLVRRERSKGATRLWFEIGDKIPQSRARGILAIFLDVYRTAARMRGLDVKDD